MITVHPGEKIRVRARFTKSGAAAVPDGAVDVRVKPEGGDYGEPSSAAAAGDGWYEAVLTAPAEIGVYQAKIQSADGGVQSVRFKVLDP